MLAVGNIFGHAKAEMQKPWLLEPILLWGKRPDKVKSKGREIEVWKRTETENSRAGGIVVVLHCGCSTLRSDAPGTDAAADIFD